MTINYDKLLALRIPEVEQTYGPKDCMLYALGLGFGLDPLDEEQLAFVYEKNLKVLPTMAVVLGYPGFWVKNLDTGIEWVKVLAGEHSFRLHRPLAAEPRQLQLRALRQAVDQVFDQAVDVPVVVIDPHAVAHLGIGRDRDDVGESERPEGEGEAISTTWPVAWTAV